MIIQNFSQLALIKEDLDEVGSQSYAQKHQTWLGKFPTSGLGRMITRLSETLGQNVKSRRAGSTRTSSIFAGEKPFEGPRWSARPEQNAARGRGLAGGSVLLDEDDGEGETSEVCCVNFFAFFGQFFRGWGCFSWI